MRFVGVAFYHSHWDHQEWASFLPSVATVPCETLLVGDLDFHLDVPDDVDARRLMDIVESVSMKQLVKEPTHNKGHTLDVVITRDLSDCVSCISVHDPKLFDNKRPRGIDALLGHLIAR